MALSSALAQEGVSRVSSYISSKLDDKSSRAQIIERLEMALYRLEFALERTAMQPITYVSLLRRRKKLKHACIEGTELLNQHKLQAQKGREEARRVVVRSSSYLQRIIRAAKLSIASLLGLMNEDHLSTSIAQKFEWYADCADKFVADVESGCPLRGDTFFRYPFVRQLFEGKFFWHKRIKGSQRLLFCLVPVISEGRGIEVYLCYYSFDPERLDKFVNLELILRLSESTDIVGIATSCLQSSASLLNLVAVEDEVMGELALLFNLQDISYSHDPIELHFQEWFASVARVWRPDPICCHANVHKPGDKNINSSELSHIVPEQVIRFEFTCYIPAAAECSLPRASDKAGRIQNAMMIDRRPPLRLSLYFTPHLSRRPTQGECYISKEMGHVADRSSYGSIQHTIDTARSEAMDCLLRQPEVTRCRVSWWPNHGYAIFCLRRPNADIIAAVASTRGRYKYNTRSAAKRKR